MLILERKNDGVLFIGSEVEIKIINVKKDSVKIGIKAPTETSILRGELSLSSYGNKVTKSNFNMD